MRLSCKFHRNLKFPAHFALKVVAMWRPFPVERSDVRYVTDSTQSCNVYMQANSLSFQINHANCVIQIQADARATRANLNSSKFCSTTSGKPSQSLANAVRTPRVKRTRQLIVTCCELNHPDECLRLCGSSQCHCPVPDAFRGYISREKRET